MSRPILEDAQRRRLTFGIISTSLGALIGNMGFQTAMREVPTPSQTALIGLAIGTALLGTGVYLLVRFFQVRHHG